MKTLKLGMLAAAAALMVPPVAAQGLSFNIGAVSLYKSNGIDQDTRQEANSRSFRPAIQGGVDYHFGNGFYLGNWNSTGTFGRADVELNFFAGYAGQISDAWGFDLGVSRFIFPSQGSFNANEWHASLTFGIATATYTRGFGGGNRDTRLGLSVAQPLTDHLTMEGGVGFRNKSHSVGGNAHDYHIGLSYDFGTGLTASALISGAQRSKLDDRNAGRDRLIFGVNQAF